MAKIKFPIFFVEGPVPFHYFATVFGRCYYQVKTFDSKVHFSAFPPLILRAGRYYTWLLWSVVFFVFHFDHFDRKVHIIWTIWLSKTDEESLLKMKNKKNKEISVHKSEKNYQMWKFQTSIAFFITARTLHMIHVTPVCNLGHPPWKGQSGRNWKNWWN